MPDEQVVPSEKEQEAISWLLLLESDEANDEQEQAFIDWLSASVENQEMFAKVEHIWQRTSDLDDVSNSAQSAEEHDSVADVISINRQRNSTRSHLLPSVVKRYRWPFASSAIAASLLLFFLAKPLWLIWQSDYRTGVGERSTITLSDGSMVVLNTASALAVSFTDAGRELTLLQGEAFFDVAKDTARPFRVTSGSLVTEALGTAFNIALVNKQAEVSVLEHRVSVADQKNDSKHLLKEGDWLSWRADDVMLSQKSIQQMATWRDGRLVFKKKTLQEVVDQLDRYYSGTLIIHGDKAANLEVSGLFSTDDPLKTLDRLEQSLPITVTRMSPYWVFITLRD